MPEGTQLALTNSLLKSTPQPKRHHFVPEMLQKRFVDEDGWLYAYSRKRADGCVYPVRPEKLFVEKHLYSEVKADGSREPEMERTLNKLETLADPVIEHIVQAARRGEVPRLSNEQLDIWCYFFAIQWRRVPDLHLTVTPDHEVSASFDKLIAELRTTQPHLEGELDQLSEPHERRRMIKNARVGVLETVSFEVMDALRSRGLLIGVIGQPEKRFVLASRPVTKLTRLGATDVRHPQCELWLPVASDIVIGLGQGRGMESLGRVTPDQVRHLNLAAAEQSTVFASASAALTRSLARPR